MSLSNFLLGGSKGKAKAIDDDLFASTVKAPAPVPSASTTSHITEIPEPVTEKKRKLPEEASSPSTSKRTKTKFTPPRSIEKSLESPKKKKQEKKKTTTSKHLQETQDEEPSGDEAPSAPQAVKQPSKREKAIASGDEEDSDEEGDPSTLVHESLVSGSTGKGKKASTKHVPQEETPEKRDARTIFVGNVSVDVAKSRPLLKQLKKHILSYVPSAKIESVRLRSVAFQKPTASSSESKHKEGESEGRQHDRDRAATWRAKQQEDGADDAVASSEKKFLTGSEKKKVAFIKSELHSGVDSVNAYVVFAHPLPDDGTRPSNLPPLPPAMDPYDAASLAADKCDGTVFLERTIRVDVVKKGVGSGQVKGGEIYGDPKRTLFVGSLDFASKEEDLRIFFEGLLSAERGPPPEADSDEEEEAQSGTMAKSSSWVKRVRIIRDKDTLLGKGFAYVQFVDRECVDEILTMEESRLKFAKRKLRVQRCKTLPGAKTKITAGPSANASQSTPKSRKQTAAPPRPTLTGPIPKGDPSLGSKISHLSKEDRKTAKKADADRVARRLAKKAAKGKMALIEKGVKLVEKERSRKRPQDHKQKTGDKGKKRVRSDRAISKLNTKK